MIYSELILIFISYRTMAGQIPYIPYIFNPNEEEEEIGQAWLPMPPLQPVMQPDSDSESDESDSESDESGYESDYTSDSEMDVEGEGEAEAEIDLGE